MSKTRKGPSVRKPSMTGGRAGVGKPGRRPTQPVRQGNPMQQTASKRRR